MPNLQNIKRPVLIVGSGRTSSSYVQDRLQHGLKKYHTVIENDLYRDAYGILIKAPWCFRYKYVGDEAEIRRRALETMRHMFATMFASNMHGWSMKCIWDEHDPQLLDDLFPEARFLHLVRDPRTNIPSMIERLQFSTDHACAIHTRANENALQFERFADRYLRVRQEDFVDDRDTTWRRVCEFLGHEFVEGVWERELNASTSTQGRIGDKRSHDRWAWKKLPAQVCKIASVLGYHE